jgi:hypothetical protein
LAGAHAEQDRNRESISPHAAPPYQADPARGRTNVEQFSTHALLIPPLDL